MFSNTYCMYIYWAIIEQFAITRNDFGKNEYINVLIEISLSHSDTTCG